MMFSYVRNVFCSVFFFLVINAKEHISDTSGTLNNRRCLLAAMISSAAACVVLYFWAKCFLKVDCSKNVGRLQRPGTLMRGKGCDIASHPPIY